ncbi:MAG: RsmB/NOP family class I SAM-dependent RNA methyltransferase, partial [Nanoarchaeota archaeon]
MKHSYQPKPLFVERMKELLGKANYGRYKRAIETEPLRSIRVNTLKISVSELKNRLEKKSWIVKQPFKENPEIFVIEGKYVDKNENNIDDGTKTNFDNRVNSVKNISVKSLAKPTLSHQSASEGGHRPSVVDGERNSGARRDEIIKLEPGELGRSLEHLLGYYYIQEIASMLPAIALNPKPNELVLDLCAAPGSKTTQMASMMKNSGVLIANDAKLDRIKILASNLERCGVMNTIITRKDGVVLCRKLKELNEKGRLSEGNLGVLAFDKILIDAPCSGEGTIRSSPKTLLMWNINTVKSLSK